MRTLVIFLSMAASISSLYTQTESYYPKNLGRIVEVATPSGILGHYHNLIGYDSTGLVKQASYENTYKIFGSLPNETSLQNLNSQNRFGAPSANDCYEIRFGNDSSRYWINANTVGLGGNLALNQLPFSVYHVGPKAASNPSVTGGTKLCIKVTDQDANGLYTPGERIFVFADLAAPLDSTYDSLSYRLTNPFTSAKSVITHLRFGLSSVAYTQGTFAVPGDGMQPSAGTVIRIVAQTADTSRPFVYAQDSLIAYTNRRYAYPFSHYSFETPSIQLINEPSGMFVEGDSIIWNVQQSQFGLTFPMIFQITNSEGIYQKQLSAKVRPRLSEIVNVCERLNQDSITDFVTQLQNFGTRRANQPNKRLVAEWIRNKFIGFGYANAYLDSFTIPSNPGLGMQYNVIAVLEGSETPDSVYILGGHHDSYSNDPNIAPGADDNASGTVCVMEVARVFKELNYQPQSTIKFITFAAEEYGLFGSASYATRARASNERIQFMINNDMISNCQNPATQWKAYIINYPNSDEVGESAVQAVDQYSSLGFQVANGASASSDSYSFYNQQYKTVYFEEFGFSPVYHTVNDLITNTNQAYLREMIKLSCALLMMKNGVNYTIDTEKPIETIHEFRLSQNYPNPFNPTTTIRYQLPENGNVILKVYNVLGQEIRTLVNSKQTAGDHFATWDGKNNYGTAVTSGVYIYRLQTGHYTKSMKMVLVR